MEFAVALVRDVVELVGVVSPSTAEQVTAISTCVRQRQQTEKVRPYPLSLHVLLSYLLRFDYTSCPRHPMTPSLGLPHSSWVKAAKRPAPRYGACYVASYAAVTLTIYVACYCYRCDSLWRQRPWLHGTCSLTSDITNE